MKKKTGRVAESLTKTSRLKRKIRQHLQSLGFIRLQDGSLGLPSIDKRLIRNLHSVQRMDRVNSNRAFIENKLPKLTHYFASGSDIIPECITPVLQRIQSDTWESDLFRLAAMTWSVPVSPGFGRRLRYLVWDSMNGKLMGIMAIGDPVFNLSVRDEYIGWNPKDRTKRLVNLLDAYVLGALPPYNTLLGGKVVASMLRTRELYDDFKLEYGNSKGIISNIEKTPRLLAITTSSSMGKSSVYNRLKLHGREYLTPIGFTKGYGHFHIPDDIFTDMRDYLRDLNHKYADMHKFGDGPNWRLRTARAALDALGFRGDILKHGVGREVFICTLADNAIRILSKGSDTPNIENLLSAEEVADAAVRRWMIPRAESRPEYQLWNNSEIATLIKSGQPINQSPVQLNYHVV